MKINNILNRNLIKVCAAVLCTCVAVAVLAQQKPESSSSEAAIKKAVLQANDNLSKAASSMDVDAFFKYFVDGDQCVIIQNGTAFKTRQEAMDAVKRGYMGVAKVDRRFNDPQVTVISPDVALLASEGTVSFTLTDGRNMDARFAVSLIFVLRDGQWKVLHGHYSMPVKM